MGAPSSHRTRITLLALALGLFLTAQPLVLNIASGRSISFQRDILQELLYWIVWALLTPLIIAAARRWPLDRKPVRRSVLVHIIISLTLAPAQGILAFALHLGEQLLVGAVPLSALGPRIVQTRMLVLWALFTGTYFYWVILGAYTAFHFRTLYAAEQLSVAELAEQGAVLQSELANARLDALQSQLRPHFLFNTLNAIAVLAVDDTAKARLMLFRLGSLLRRSLDERQHEVPLDRELAFLNEYLDIQRVRFGDALMVSLDVAPDVLDARVPVFLLQPLVENALEHGAPENGGATRISLKAARVGEMLHINVEDSGPGLAPTAGDDSGVGVGLRNTRERLRRLYGDRASLVLRSLGGSGDGATSGACVDIMLPFAPMAACES